MPRDDRSNDQAAISDRKHTVVFDGRKLLNRYILLGCRRAWRGGLQRHLSLPRHFLVGIGGLARITIVIGLWRLIHVSLHAAIRKRFAVQTFRLVHSRLGLSLGGEFDLRELLADVCNWETFRGIWAVEGLGFQFINTALVRCDTTGQLLCGEFVAALPKRTRLAFHIGAGLAFSMHRLIPVLSGSRRAEIAPTIHEIIQLSCNHVQHQYRNAVIESTGFVAWSGRQDDVIAIGKTLLGIGPSLADCFWHGVGRGMYFSPDTFLPVRNFGWTSLAKARRIPPDQRARDNAIAGLTWAATLINLPRPEIIDMFLKAHNQQIGEAAAMADGVGCAALVWFDWSGEPDYLDRLCRYRPEYSTMNNWARIVESPVSKVLKKMHPKQQNPADLFHFQAKSFQAPSTTLG